MQKCTFLCQYFTWGKQEQGNAHFFDMGYWNSALSFFHKPYSEMHHWQLPVLVPSKWNGSLKTLAKQFVWISAWLCPLMPNLLKLPSPHLIQKSFFLKATCPYRISLKLSFSFFFFKATAHFFIVLAFHEFSILLSCVKYNNLNWHK